MHRLILVVTCRYELSKVIEELKALRADIIGLQEVDIACERSNNIDTGDCISLFYNLGSLKADHESAFSYLLMLDGKQEVNSMSSASVELRIAQCLSRVAFNSGEAIAEALGMNYTFLCEFEELHSPVRDARSQAGNSSHTHNPSVSTMLTAPLSGDTLCHVGLRVSRCLQRFYYPIPMADGAV